MDEQRSETDEMLGLSGRSAAMTGVLAVALVASSSGPQSSLGQAPGVAATMKTTREAAVAAGPLWRGADPWVIFHQGQYYGCQSRASRIEVWKSDRLGERGERRIVWEAPRMGWNRAQVWAPELHWVRGRWYIYYAASTGRNESHRMGVLECEGADPQGRWIDRGMLYTGDDPAARRDPRWAIDGTILERGDELYLVWSGWENDQDVQFLYAAPMSDPATVSGARVKLCANDTYNWERVGDDPKQRGLHEGPAVLARNGRIFLVYSCSGSWQSSYKLGMLWADAKANLLDPRSWNKVSHPVFESTREVFGVGHCSFTTSPDGRQDWIVYHSKVERGEGWARVVRMQRFTWTEDGFPDFGRPVGNAPPVVEIA
ncbi:MAG TPA: glycoside hydrolase family 43 protein, partial [Tepidisphaeraceae bacterium]